MDFVNKVDKNGRVNVGTPGFGLSVSPRLPGFDNHLEPAIKNLVRVLLASGFKTVSSCQGHNILDSPFIILAFVDYQSAESFCQYLDKNIFLCCSIGKKAGDTVAFSHDDIISVTVDEINQWFGVNYEQSILVRLELKSERFLWLTNIEFIKKILCNLLACYLKKKLSHYEHIT